MLLFLYFEPYGVPTTYFNYIFVDWLSKENQELEFGCSILNPFIAI